MSLNSSAGAWLECQALRSVDAPRRLILEGQGRGAGVVIGHLPGVQDSVDIRLGQTPIATSTCWLVAESWVTGLGDRTQRRDRLPAGIGGEGTNRQRVTVVDAASQPGDHRHAPVVTG